MRKLLHQHDQLILLFIAASARSISVELSQGFGDMQALGEMQGMMSS